MDLPDAMWTAAAAVVASLATYVLKRRSESGSVQTTDAQTLWKEASAYRQVLLDQIHEQDATLDRRDLEIAQRDARIRELERALLRAGGQDT